MILLPVPLRYRPLTRHGDWRLSVTWSRRWVWARRIDAFPEGTVYRVWLARIMVKLMVHA